MKRAIQQFVFTGLLTKHMTIDLEASGLLRGRAVTGAERQEQDLFAPIQENIRMGSLQMQRCYRILYVLENLIRNFISSRFEEKDGAEWFETRANGDMKRDYESRKAKEQANSWHTGRNRHPIFYLDFGHLGRLITNHWSEFEDLLPNQSWVQSRLNDAELSRNVIAHTNLLSSEEVDRIEVILRDWIKQIG